MSSLFNPENSDSGDELKINNGYANNYNSWRQKEEFNKLKTKYSEHITNLESLGEDSETSSDEDEEGEALTEQVEKNFYKTLACLKKKDPKIYDDKVTFFDENASENSKDHSGKKSQKEKKLFLRDYERRIILERGGRLSDSEDEDTVRSKRRESRAPTYVEEQLALKESISKALNDDEDEDEDEENGENGLLVPKAKTETEKLKDEETYREWLKGQKAEVEKSEKEELKPLRDFWTDPNLDPNEKFLRDYVLNKKFLGQDNDEDDNRDYEQTAHDSDVDLSEDERNIEKQEEFEHKYNFRFEEPDQEFIKRYPRTLENSLRKKDNRRSQKRAEVKQRKDEDKIRKREELKQLKALKRKEIADKIAQLKEITGNDDVQFENIDLDGEFDPAEHDRKMREIFNDEYYAEPEGDIKPEFPDIDEELGIERNWDDYDPENEEIVQDNDAPRVGGGHCEDPEFNMDADYDPTRALQNELIDSSRRKKKRRRSKFADVIAKEKPKFDPNLHSSYRDYIEQYYALDYEDMIDDLPCRFKYRKVVPNDYGLSVEEILMADDRELNKWCSLKKALEHKPENIEMNEVRIYQQKAKNEAYKKKILKSLYAPKEEPQDPATLITPPNRENEESTRKKRKRKKKNQSVESVAASRANDEKPEQDKLSESQLKNEASREEIPKGKRKIKISNSSTTELTKTREETPAVSKTPTGKVKKRKTVKRDNDPAESSKPEVEEPRAKKPKIENIISKSPKISSNKIKMDKKRKKHEKRNAEIQNGVSSTVKNAENNERPSKKGKKQQRSSVTTGKKSKITTRDVPDQVALLSSERLKAYGLNPKKFKNKLKYGKR